MLSEGLYSLVISDPTVGAILAARKPLIGEPKTSGMFPGVLPQGEELPAIVYQEIHGDGQMTMDGPDGLRYSRMQFDCYGTTFKQSKALARALRQLLEGTTGLLIDGTVLGDAEQASEIDTYEEVPACWRTLIDTRIAYEDLSGSGQPIQNFQQPSAPQFAFADAETPAGALDGVNKTFTLAHPPNPAASLELVLNLGTLTQGIDYTLSGVTILFATAPDSGAVMRASYRY